MKAQRVKDRIWVQWQGRLYSVAADLRQARARGSDEAEELAAPFACKVLKVHVQAGQALEKGDSVVVVEAMKMEYAYSSPRKGTIARVLTKEGDILQGGALFVEWKD